jgi:cell division protein FtsW
MTAPATAPTAAPVIARGRELEAGRRVTAGLRLLDRPLTSYYLVLGITMLLLALGLVMVLSTSSAQAITQGASPYAGFQKQLLGVVIGLPLMWIAARSSPTLFRAAAYPMVAVSVLGLLLVLVMGQTVDGGERWIMVMGFQVQPSEFAKLAFVRIPLLPGAAIFSMLVMLGDDFGTTFILLVIFLALLWVIGSPLRLFAGMLGLMAFSMVILIIVAKYRMARITGFFDAQSQASTAGYQTIQGTTAVGSGGWLGVGLGAGKMKFGWVPNATTDFIFAIIGEELGLVGTLCVSLLYGGLAFAGLRIARRVPDTFMRLAAAAATAWIAVQALVNIGAVIGLLPITGVPLPLVSAGLSSLLVTMVALGMLMSFAKREPGAAQALAAAGPGPGRRVLSWLGLATGESGGRRR